MPVSTQDILSLKEQYEPGSVTPEDKLSTLKEMYEGQSNTSQHDLLSLKEIYEPGTVTPEDKFSALKQAYEPDTSIPQLPGTGSFMEWVQQHSLEGLGQSEVMDKVQGTIDRKIKYAVLPHLPEKERQEASNTWSWPDILAESAGVKDKPQSLYRKVIDNLGGFILNQGLNATNWAFALALSSRVKGLPETPENTTKISNIVDDFTKGKVTPEIKNIIAEGKTIAPDLAKPPISSAAGELASTISQTKIEQGAIPKISAVFEPQVKLDVTNAIGEETIEALKTGKVTPGQLRPIKANEPLGKILGLEKDERLFQRVTTSLLNGEITVKDIPGILKGEGLTHEQIISWKDTISTAGRQLNVLSKLSKELTLEYPEFADVLKQTATGWTTLLDAYRRIDNVRRGMLVSQLATSARNAISQAGRHTLQIFDDLISGSMEAVTGKANLKQAFAPALEDVLAIGRQLKPSQRARVNAILDKFPLEKAKLLNNISGDVSLDQKVVRIINSANTAQEYYFRKLRFDASLTSELMRRGIDPLKGKVPSDAIQSAVKTALENTFALTPSKKGPGQAVLSLYREFPFLTALGNPFPRFWVNSLKFLWDFNPTGFTRLLDSKFRAELISKSPREAYSALAKATLGTSMLAAGVAIRNSDWAGEKWYEIKLSDKKRLDTRAFAPFSTYLFLGEAISHPEKLDGMDWLQGAVSINRISGTGLIIVDIVRSGTPESTIRKIKEFTGQYLGGFTVPFRTLKDFMAVGNKEEAIVRSTKESPLKGPTMANIPGISRALPEAPRLTREEPYISEQTGLRQISGLTFRTKNKLEQEIDNLGIASNLYPKTGDPKLNRWIVEKGRSIGTKLSEQFKNPEFYSAYSKMDNLQRKEYLQNTFSVINQMAKQNVLMEHTNELVDKYSLEMDKMKPIQRREYLKKIKAGGITNPLILNSLIKKYRLEGLYERTQ